MKIVQVLWLPSQGLSEARRGKQVEPPRGRTIGGGGVHHMSV